MAYLAIKNLSKSFQNNLVLDHINFEIEKGTFLSLLGPSGCGKTTTLRLIAGFEHQDEGTIHIGGNTIDTLPPYKRNIGLVFQSYALFPHMTVGQNIAYGLEQRNFTKGDIKKEVSKALEMVQLTGFENRKPRQLSGGQQQRVALARALVIKPSLLLLDESLSALDKKLRVDMQIELRQIQKEVGITTLFVTHDQEEAMTLSDQIAVMKNGKIVQMDTPQNIYKNPVNSFVASFIGQSNFLKGRIKENSQFVLQNGSTFSLPQQDYSLYNQEEYIISVRPEKIRVDQTRPSYPHIQGKVKFVTYIGNLSMYLIEALGHDIRIQQQNDSYRDQLKVNDEIYFSWNASDQSILTE
ncbi:ABC transporter ATP-binding protein [Neobacillus niacini]|uniref:ABC transporter ATP-binding protein n=1 Tax=Neobacillus niacini TaxID=86668 RepID=UPI0007AB5A57|nr:ABC transporter ATP-binding protein [Neobacillus niacini]MEC1522808.1 ABC transporter ATP-binding protein [Neobacillus niacini]